MLFVSCVAALMFGVPEGLRPAAEMLEARSDACCCKDTFQRHNMRNEKITEAMDLLTCQTLKQKRPDRPFWWHGGEGQCCWTSEWFCTPALVDVFLDLDGGGGEKVSGTSAQRKCPSASPRGTVQPHDTTYAYNRIMSDLEGKIAKMLIKKAADIAWGAAIAQSVVGGEVADAVGHAKDTRDAIVYGRGGAFDGTTRHVSPGRSLGCKGEVHYSYVGEKTGTARTQEMWKALGVNGQMKSDWLHVQEGSDGSCFVEVRDPASYRPEHCITDDPEIEELCVERDEGTGTRGFYMKANIDLSKEVKQTTDPTRLYGYDPTDHYDDANYGVRIEEPEVWFDDRKKKCYKMGQMDAIEVTCPPEEAAKVRCDRKIRSCYNMVGGFTNIVYPCPPGVYCPGA